MDCFLLGTLVSGVGIDSWTVLEFPVTTEGNHAEEATYPSALPLTSVGCKPGHWGQERGILGSTQTETSWVVLMV